MLFLTVAIFGLLTQALAQTITAPAAATTLDPGDCSGNTDWLSCYPQSSNICLASSINDIEMGIQCACDHAQTAISCYSRYCPGPYSESVMSELSAASTAICNELSTISFPSREPTGVVTTTAVKTSGVTTGTGTSAGVASTASGIAASATSKAAAKGGTGHAVPVLGGLLGAFIGAVGVFL